MKTYSDLLAKTLNPETVKRCMLDAAEKKTHREEVLRTFVHFDKTYDLVVKCALEPNYYPREDKKHIIKDGTSHKTRVIEKPLFCPEQILHHVIVEPFKEVLTNGLYEQVYGCLPASYCDDGHGHIRERKYGPHAAAKKLRKWVQVNAKIYVAELDVHHAYDSVDLEILLTQLREVIKDEDWLRLAEHFIRAKEGQAKGLPLGHYTSPWLFNFYLKDFDHFAAAQGVKYLRFADNLFLISRNKRKLRRAVQVIRDYLHDRLKLTLNKSAQIYRFEYVDRKGEVRGRAVNALGFIIHHNRVALRKARLKSIRRKAIRIEKKENPTWHDGAAMFAKLPWIRASNTYTYYKNHIQSRINTHQLKGKVRRYSRALEPICKERRRIIHDGLERSKRLSG